MKRILLYTTTLLFLAFTSCESELDDRHFDPDGFTDANIEFLYTQGAAKTIDNDYADFYSYVFRKIGIMTQSVAQKPGEGKASIYRVESDMGRWERFYVYRMQELAEMEKKYSYAIADADKAIYTPYMETGKILKAYNTMMATDMLGAMPYTEAWCSRNGLYGQPVILTPKYDSQKDIYYALLADLESAAAYLKANSLDETIEKHRLFKGQDIIYGGDYSKWYKFANSLRLRAAMRISNVDEAKAKEVLAKLSEADLITVNADNVYTFSPNTAHQGNDWTGIWRALKESHKSGQRECAYAPQNMIKIFDDAKDPRKVVFFQPPSDLDGNIYDKSAPILGYPESADDASVIVRQLSEEEVRQTYGLVNSTTIRNNVQFPKGVGITASDVYILLAEARFRNLISFGNAEDFYNKSIILSVQEYYNYYKNSSESVMKDPDIAGRDVSDATLSTWINSSTYKFNASKAMEQFATQRWINMWILQPFDNWAECRRTDLPVMVEDIESGVLLNRENAPVRFMYPTSESTLNAANFEEYRSDNDPKVRVWWDVK